MSEQLYRYNPDSSARQEKKVKRDESVAEMLLNGLRERHQYPDSDYSGYMSVEEVFSLIKKSGVTRGDLPRLKEIITYLPNKREEVLAVLYTHAPEELTDDERDEMKQLKEQEREEQEWQKNQARQEQATNRAKLRRNIRRALVGVLSLAFLVSGWVMLGGNNDSSSDKGGEARVAVTTEMSTSPEAATPPASDFSEAETEVMETTMPEVSATSEAVPSSTTETSSETERKVGFEDLDPEIQYCLETDSGFEARAQTYLELIEQYDWDYKTAFCIMVAEDRTLDPVAKNTQNANGSVDSGLFQINSVHKEMVDLSRLTEPAYNVETAYKIYKLQGFEAWSTHNSGTDKRFASFYDYIT